MANSFILTRDDPKLSIRKEKKNVLRRGLVIERGDKEGSGRFAHLGRVRNGLVIVNTGAYKVKTTATLGVISRA